MVARAYARGTHRPEWGTFVLVRVRDERALGTLGFHGPPDETGSAEVGYGLQEKARGHGHATAALRALAVWGLGQPGSPTATYAGMMRDDATRIAAALSV